MAPSPLSRSATGPVAKRDGTEVRLADVVRATPMDRAGRPGRGLVPGLLMNTRARRIRDEQDRRNRRGPAAGVRGGWSAGRGDQGEDQIARPTRTRVHARRWHTDLAGRRRLDDAAEGRLVGERVLRGT